MVKVVYRVVIEESHMDHDITSIIPLKIQTIENRQVFVGIMSGQSALYKQALFSCRMWYHYQNEANTEY